MKKGREKKGRQKKERTKEERDKKEREKRERRRGKLLLHEGHMITNESCSLCLPRDLDVLGFLGNPGDSSSASPSSSWYLRLVGFGEGGGEKRGVCEGEGGGEGRGGSGDAGLPCTMC